MQTSTSAPIETLLKAIAESLNIRLKLAKLDQQGIAKMSDLNRNTISAALSGKDIKLSTLIRITRTLDFTDWMIPLLNPPPPSPFDQLSKKPPQKKQKVNKPVSRRLGRKKGEYQ